MKHKKLKFQNIKGRNYNFGFGFLKMILSLDVIRSHCFNPNSTNNKYLIYFLEKRRIHVPSFVILSFYFIHKKLISIKSNFLFERLERLLIPYILWPIIIYNLNNFIIRKFFKLNIIYSLENLKKQLLWGNEFIIQLWFQWDLIFITILFFIIIFVFRKYHTFFIQLLAIFAYILQYSGYNKKFYYSLKREKKECLGRLAEMIPYASTGFSLAYLNIINNLSKHKIKTLTFSILIYNLIEKYSIFSIIKGVAYPGIRLNVRATCLIFIFSLFPSEKITNSKIKKILICLTSYTPAVFYLHWTIYIYFKEFVMPIKRGSFFGCIIIYFICYSISFIFIKFVGKTKLKNLFS